MQIFLLPLLSIFFFNLCILCMRIYKMNLKFAGVLLPFRIRRTKYNALSHLTITDKRAKLFFSRCDNNDYNFPFGIGIS